MPSGNYVELASEGFRAVRRFASLDEWYRSTLRAEYAQRYGSCVDDAIEQYSPETIEV